MLGGAVLAFGLYQIHSLSGVTEGGTLGLTLLLEHHFSLSPSVTTWILNLICYGIGWKVLGGGLLLRSAVCTLSFSLVYAFNERFPPLFPSLSELPLLAAILGAAFVGVGVGLCVRAGGAPCGDDALALSLSRLFSCKIELVYLISDLVVLVLSLSYIPLGKIAFSLLTVVLSGQLIGAIERWGKGKEEDTAE